MKINVDVEKCIGSGACEMLAPEVFEISDDGLCYVLVKEAGAELESSVNEAIESCPTSAISVT